MNEAKKKEFLANLGQRVRQARIEKDMTLEELANKIGYTTENARSSMQKIESGKSDLGASKLYALAKVLDTPISVLMGYKDSGHQLTSETTLTTDESHLMDAYRTLNPTGKREAVKRVEELTYIPAYTAQKIADNLLAAAHEADDATEETRKHDDDIMMDDDEWD